MTAARRSWVSLTSLASLACVLLGVGVVPAQANQVQRFPAEPPLRDVPAGRAIANLDDAACRSILRANGTRATIYRGEEHGRVRGGGLLLRAPLNGVRFENAGRSELHAVVECRLALALLAWTPILREFGVTRVQHMSTFRPNAHVAGTSRVSGHASALAIDFRYLEFADGTRLDVLTDWTSRERGAAPCVHPEGELGPSAVLRRVVCRAVEADLFQVVVSPHHNDAHANHVHLEVRPDVTWSSIQ